MHNQKLGEARSIGLLVDAAAFYRYRRENPEFDRFVAATNANNNSRGQQIRYVRERTRIRSAARREEANDYHKIRSMIPALLS